jgi:hypothetical protein
MPAGAHSSSSGISSPNDRKTTCLHCGHTRARFSRSAVSLETGDIGLVQLGESGVVGNVVFWHLKGFLKYRLPWRARELADLDVLEFFV